VGESTGQAPLFKETVADCLGLLGRVCGLSSDYFQSQLPLQGTSVECTEDNAEPAPADLTLDLITVCDEVS
jgi:hypothetical protein